MNREGSERQDFCVCGRDMGQDAGTFPRASDQGNQNWEDVIITFPV